MSDESYNVFTLGDTTKYTCEGMNDLAYYGEELQLVIQNSDTEDCINGLTYRIGKSKTVKRASLEEGKWIIPASDLRVAKGTPIYFDAYFRPADTYGISISYVNMKTPNGNDVELEGPVYGIGNVRAVTISGQTECKRNTSAKIKLTPMSGYRITKVAAFSDGVDQVIVPNKKGEYVIPSPGNESNLVHLTVDIQQLAPSSVKIGKVGTGGTINVSGDEKQRLTLTLAGTVPDYSRIRIDGGENIWTSGGVSSVNTKKKTCVATVSAHVSSYPINKEDYSLKVYYDAPDSEESVCLGEFFLNPTNNLAGKVPTVSVVRIDAYNVDLSVKLPKKVSPSDNLYYKVVATRLSDPGDDWLKQDPYIYHAPSNKSELRVDLMDLNKSKGNFYYGAETPIKYQIEVCLVRKRVDNRDISSDNVSNSRVVTVETLPYKETTKLTLKGSTRSAYPGGVLTLTPVWDSNVTARVITGYSMADEYGEVNCDTFLDYDRFDNKIALRFPSNFPVGKYKVYVDAKGGVSASYSFTVQRGINKVELFQKSEQLFKKAGKELKTNVSLVGFYNGEEKDPDADGHSYSWKDVEVSMKAKGYRYELCGYDGNNIDPYLKSCLKLDKHGNITINKSFTPSPNAAQNKFGVKGFVLSQNGDWLESNKVGFEIKSSSDYAINHLELVRDYCKDEATIMDKAKDGSVRVELGHLRENELSVVAYSNASRYSNYIPYAQDEDDGTITSWAAENGPKTYRFSVSGKSLKVDPYSGVISATGKTGISTVTVTATDGSGLSKSIKINVLPAGTPVG